MRERERKMLNVLIRKSLKRFSRRIDSPKAGRGRGKGENRKGEGV